MTNDLATFERDLGRLRPRALRASFRGRLHRLLALWRFANGGDAGEEPVNERPRWFNRHRFDTNN